MIAIAMRFALIRGSDVGFAAEAIMKRHLETEVEFNSNIWFAKLPTETNLSDLPSRCIAHPELTDEKNGSVDAVKVNFFFESVSKNKSEMKRKGDDRHIGHRKLEINSGFKCSGRGNPVKQID